MESRHRSPVVWLGLATHLVVVPFVWRDIARRRPDQLRGSKTLWRILTALNSGNALLYLLIGRR